MKRRAFTLVELMVVISVLSLLVAMLMPYMGSVYAMARATICRGNLQRLGDAFSISRTKQAIITAQAGGTAGVFETFPEALAWPAVPGDAVSDTIVYQCPEDTGKKSALEMYKALEYVNEHGKFTMDTLEGASSMYKSRRGANEKGGYTEYLLQDDYGNGQFELMDFNGWIDTDPVIRIYDRGEILIFDRIPDTEDWAAPPGTDRGPGYPSNVNTCGNLNLLHFQGAPAFADEGCFRLHRGKTIKLADWDGGLTNYGINSYAHKYPYGAKCIVLVDYKELVVEIDTPLEAEAILLRSIRHLGKVNYLRGDGSVRTASPMEISPRLKLSMWRPASSGIVPP